MIQQLPFFEENSTTVPDGWGIEHSHDGGFYVYRYDAQDILRYLKNEQGLDRRYRSWDEAIGAISEYIVRKGK